MKQISIAFIFMYCVGLCAGDYSRSPSSVQPEGLPGAIFPEKQTEGHTCGLHSIRSIYKSYSLPVDDFRLRARLGTDAATFPFFDSTRGTIHPDILRVLDQDGFEFEVVDLKKQTYRRAIFTHLDMKHYALVLIERKENSNLHWVVFSGYDDDSITVVDSLFPESYEEVLDFVDKYVVSVVLIHPRNSSEEAGQGETHSQGLWEGFKSLFR